MKKQWDGRQLAVILAVGVVFVAISLLAHVYRDTLAALVGVGGVSGMVAFVVLTMCFEIFFIPLDLVILVPLGAVLYGPIPTALLSTTGWTLGASVSFALARQYGIPFVSKIVGMRKIEYLRRRVPRANLFWKVVLLRMLVPVDVLSYALGLFAPIAWWKYVIATAIGVAPFGFYFAFAGALPLRYQLLALAAALGFVLFVLSRYRGETYEDADGPVV